MATITFYEKPGCGGNARQRDLLEAAGHTLQRRNLLSTPWTAESLLAFLSPLPVAQWFNRAAPRIKHGEVQPDFLSAEAALALLLAEPLLIRRPLMQREDGARMVGFELDEVARFVRLGLGGTTDASGTTGTAGGSSPRSMEGCAAAPLARPCAEPAA